MGREWSDTELNELGDMLVRGLSIEEIAHRLCRDKVEVRNKVAEVGRACLRFAAAPDFWTAR